MLSLMKEIEIEGNSEDEQNEIYSSNPPEPKISQSDPIYPQKTFVTEDENTTKTKPLLSGIILKTQPQSWKHHI